MLTFWSLLRRNLRYYFRTHLAVVAGVAVAVGVLTGALLVGDSVRGSLRDLFVSRLGKTDYAVVSSGFFREALAEEMFAGSAPLVAFEGMVTNERTGLRRAGVQVYGVDGRFWKFHGTSEPEMSPRGALLTESLEAELETVEGDTVLLRVERPSEVSRGSLHGIKEDVGRTIRLTVQPFPAGLAATGLPEFSIYPRQDSIPAIFVPLARLQRDLEQAGRVNTILVQGTSKDDVVAALRESASLDDLSLRVRLLEPQNALSVESVALMLSPPLVVAVEEAASDLSLHTASVFTYLANTLRIGEKEIPYSLVAAVDADLYPGAGAPDGIVLNDWAGEDLGARMGDRLTMEYYVWRDEGRIETESAEFTVERVVPVEGIAADRDLAPTYPGISGTDDLSDWEPPFPLDLRRVRDKDEDYWDRFRTTPKAFLPLARGQELWPVRQGRVTSIRLTPPESEADFERALREKLDPLALGFTVVAAREEGLRASSGATDFGQYFVYFSYFLVVAAVLLTGLFFKLGVEQRHREVGTLLAIGFTPARVRRLFLAEGLILSLAGAALGTLVALAYASLILYGLRTWWVDAVGTRLLTLHIGGFSIVLGLTGGILAALFATWLTLRYLAKVPARRLLAGEVALEGESARRLSRRAVVVSVGSLLGSMLLLAGSFASIVSEALGFFGAGNLLLVALLGFQWIWLKSGGTKSVSGTGPLALARLGFRNATSRPGRSLVAIALIAFATFTIVAVDAFRKDPSALDAFDRSAGSGGYALAAESLLPLHWDPNTEEGRSSANLPYPGDADFVEMTFQTFRLRSGDDASCLNLYRPQNPRVLAPTGDFLERGGFRFGATLASTPEEKANPWLLLNRELPDGAVPVIGDANSMAYVLHLGLGGDFVLPREGETPLRLRLVGMLRDSIFQSELLMGEENFLRHFPEVSGFRYFLVETEPSNVDKAESVLEERLEDFAFDASTTASKLASFHRVENTYLSTFQSLGGLGLLLGTLGLAAIVLRNVLERRRELALLRAVGYRPRAFALMILSENALLLILGLLTGCLSAVVAIGPAIQERGWSFGSGAALGFLAAVAVAGALASLVAVLSAWRSPLLPSLRDE
jgi:ABC-type antimicrobial peptide transport system permease subunit